MDKAEPGHKIPVGTFGKCSEYPYLDSYLHLPYSTMVKHTLKSTLSIYEIMQVLGISVFDKTPLKDLIAQNQKNQSVKEQKLVNLFDAET